MSDEKKATLKTLTKDDLKKVIAEGQASIEQYKTEIFKQHGIIAAYGHLLANYDIQDAKEATSKPSFEVK